MKRKQLLCVLTYYQHSGEYVAGRVGAGLGFTGPVCDVCICSHLALVLPGVRPRHPLHHQLPVLGRTHHHQQQQQQVIITTPAGCLPRLSGQFGPGSIRFPRTHACCVLPGNRPVWIILLGSRGAGHNSLKLILDDSQSIPYCLPECWNSVINIKRLRFGFVLCLQKKSFLFRLKCCILETLW